MLSPVLRKRGRERAGKLTLKGGGKGTCLFPGCEDERKAAAHLRGAEDRERTLGICKPKANAPAPTDGRGGCNGGARQSKWGQGF